MSGANVGRYLDKKGNLLRIHDLHPWSLKNMLTEKYLIHPVPAADISNFLLQMLKYKPWERDTA